MINDPELEQRLRAHFQNRYESAPDHTAFWEQLAPHLEQREKGSSKQLNLLKSIRRWRKPRTLASTPAPVRKPQYVVRFALVASLVLCMLVFATNAFALVIPSLNNIISAINSVLELKGLPYSSIEESKTANGYTLTIGKVYADANLVTIAYAITAPDGTSGKSGVGKFILGTGKLTTDQGIVLPQLGGFGNLLTFGQTSGNLTYFDASPIKGTPKQLHLHLELPATTTHSTLNFYFTVAFHPGRIVYPNQSIAENGKILTLKKVVVTPSETRAYVSGFTQNDRGQGIFPQIIVEKNAYGPDYVYEGSDPWTMNFNQSLFNEQGIWTLTIHESIYKIMPPPQQYILLKSIYWTFHFTVPKI